MNPPASNVRVASNIFPVTTVETIQLPGFPESTTGVIDDPVFRTRIWCKVSLRKLHDLKLGAVIDERHRKERLLQYHLVRPSQIKACWDPDSCYACAAGERPYGPVTKGNVTIVECRCERADCPGRNSDNS